MSMMNGSACFAWTLLAVGTTGLVAVSCESPANAPCPERPLEAAVAANGATTPASGTLLYHHVLLGAHGAALGGLGVGPGGDLWVAGSFSETFPIGDATLTSAGSHDLFVARLDPTGNPRWSARVGGPEYDEYQALTLDARGNAILAYDNKPTSLVKLDPRGNVLWQKVVLQAAPVLHDPWLRERLEATASDGAGGMLLVNRSDGRVQVGSSVLRGLNCRLVNVDANGDVKWSTPACPGGFGGPNRVVGIAVDGMGNAIVGQDNIDGKAPRIDKYDKTGARHWWTLVRATGGEKHLFGVAAGPHGEILLSGTAPRSPADPSGVRYSLPETWLMKLDPSGTRLWVTPMDLGKVVVDGAGDVYVATSTSVTKLDPTGAVIWRWSAHVTGEAIVGAAAIDAGGHLVVAGVFHGSYDFGDGPVDSGADAALFVLGFNE